MGKFVERLQNIFSSQGSSDKVNLNKNFNSAVIVAAGNGARMRDINCGLNKTKQMICLGGEPVIVRTIKQFEECSFINEIVIVARKDEIEFYEEFKSSYNFKKITDVVEGGETRQKSVLLGFEAIFEKSKYVAIHDGARCLVTPEMIENVFSEAYIHGSAAAAEKSKDTIKKSDDNNFIFETIDRKYLWHAQTPQVFKADIYRAAAYIAKKNDYTATDDCMLVENIGFKIKLVDCGSENLKITTPDDFYIAEAILNLRKNRKTSL